jgi:RHS repeat-associated protein
MKRVIISALIGLSIFGIGFGQQSTNNADQSLRGSGRVNPSTLAMEFELPLGSYPGRGINIPISLSYSSKLWRMKYLGSTDGGLNGTCRSLSQARYAENSASGWTTSLATPYIEYVDWNNSYTTRGFPLDEGTCPNAPPPENNSASYILRLSIHLPSGETHELRADDTPLSYDRSTGIPAYVWNQTYYAVDGSNIKYVENSNTNTYRLLMPDGSYYDFQNTRGTVYGTVARSAVKFTDRNGNYTTYAGGVWTDTLGRTFSAPIAPTAPTQPTTAQNPISYAMPGMTGAYKFHWKKLKGDSAAESGLTDFDQDLKYTGDKIAMTTNGGWTVRDPGTYLFQSINQVGAGQYVLSSPNVFNPIVLTEIELPTGQKYKFSYNIYGIINRITYPTGGEEKFTHSQVAPLTPGDGPSVSDQTNRGVVNRKLYVTAGQGIPYEWNYLATYVAPAGYKVSVTSPDGTISERFLHQGRPPCIGCEDGNFGFDNGLAGMSYEERNFSNTGDLVSRKLTHWTKKTFSTWPTEADWHPRVTHEESIVYDESGNGVSTTTKFEYEGDLNLRETPVLVNKTTQYAFVPIVVAGGGGPLAPIEPDEDPDPSPTPVPTPIPPTPVKTVETTYLINDPNYAAVKSYYTAQNMVGLVTTSQVKDGAGTVVSRSETIYDDVANYPLITPGSPGQWTGPVTGFRGNPNTLKAWDSTKGLVSNSTAYVSTHAQFDNFGNQIKAWDAKGNFSTTAFDTTHYAYPTSVTSPIPSDGTYGSNSAFVTTATFDSTTGLPLTTTDANGLETRIEYDPGTLRLLNTKTFYSNVQVGSTAETIYHDEDNNCWIKSRAQIDSNLWTESITYFDGLGRAWKSEEVNSKGNIFVEKEFDDKGRVLRVSNPFRSGETKVWTTNVYDEASRVKEVVLQDGSLVKTDYGVSVTGVVGVTKQITDQASKKRKGISDALGRMVRVIEDPTGQNLSTDYVFDTLGNLRKTIQGEQNRFFMHDSLGRLLYAKQPEQEANAGFVATDPITSNTAWSVKYEFDDNGNITRTTDARGLYIDGTYDNLNRLKVRNYSDPDTPDVSFYYDGKYLDITDTLQTATGSAKGKATGVKSSISRTNNTAFDNLGRLQTHLQITDGQTYSTGYTYNLSGGLVSETYPSGRTVNYEINTDGDLARVWGQKASTITTYANAFNYNVSGAVDKMRLGNGKWETATYNNRMQITQIGLGTGSNDTSLLKLEYSYGINTLNNGSLREQKITVPNAGGSSGFTATQTYAYDDLNRLQSATETIGGNQTWKQTFTIDRYGNRRFDVNNTTTLGSCTEAICNPTISTATNRLTSTGYDYDENGNVTENAEGRQFLYDAENHQKAVKDDQNNTIGEYLYDGEGKRVKKLSETETTVFVYNASGQLVAEYSTQMSQTQQVSYLTTDHLGSPRVTTNQLGAVTNRKDYSAFGEETVSSQRVGALSYTSGSDELRKGYTGYEKDEESGLDFAQARYYNSTHGRFTSVDPLTASASIRDPQTFNRYSYVLNSPYKFTDPLGLLPASWNTSFGGGGFCSASNSGCDEGEDLTTASIEAYQKKQQEQEKKRQEQKRKKREAERRKKQTPNKPPKPPTPAKPEQPTQPSKSYVESDSDDPNIAAQNSALTSLFTDGNGIARTSKGKTEVFFNGGASHFRYEDGQIIGIHVYGDESGATVANLFIPDGFEATYNGGASNTVSAYNKDTGDFLLILHVKGVSSQRGLEKNMKTKNAAGSSLIGQTGGPGGDGSGYIHSCLKIFNGYKGYKHYDANYNPARPGSTGVVARWAYSDFRNLIK